MSHKKCQVINCLFETEKKYHFPKSSEQCIAWLCACGDKHLLQLSHDKLQQKVICDVHFEERYKLNKRLSNVAIPTLNLPDPIDASQYGDNLQDKNINLPTTTINDADYSNNGFLDTNKINLPMVTAGEIMEITEEIPNIQGDMPETSNMSETINNYELHCSRDLLVERELKLSPQSKMIVKRKKDSIIRLFHTTRTSQLSVRDKNIYNNMVHLMKIIREMRRRKLSLKERLQKFQKLEKCKTIISEMPDVMQKFFLSNIDNFKKNKYNRRFSIEDKAFALTLAKRSPKLYRFLQNVFCLPSIETLRKFIQNVPIHCGISDSIFENLQNRVEKFNDYREKYCILLFDEMKISANFYYNASTDVIEGVVDTGFDRNGNIADHVQVWMIKGIYGQRPWKQPLLYTFCKGTSSWQDIARMYKEIVKRCSDAGLVIVASICDQGSTNVKAIRTMIFDSKRNAQTEVERRDDIIRIEGLKIIPLYDPPHLLKCIRNNFLKKDCEYISEDGSKEIAKWADVILTYHIDKSRGSDGFLEKIKDSHVIPEKIKKMRVRYCTQIFSNTYAKVMTLYSEQELKSRCQTWKMSREGIYTAKFLKFFNDLFDTLNGGINMHDRSTNNETMTSTLTENSKEEYIWNCAITFLRNMRFIKRTKRDKPRPDVLTNFEHTLKGFKLLRNYLKELGFNSFATREFNQDPLENFFCQIRQHGGRNINPTCSNFSAYYRTLLINSCTQYVSHQSNCEQNNLENLIQFVTITVNKLDEAYNNIDIPEDIMQNINNDVKENYLNVIENISSIVATCDICCAILLNNKTIILDYIKKVSAVIDYFLNNYYYIKNITKCIKKNCTKYNIDINDNILCEEKHIEEYILKKYIITYIRKKLKTVNNIFNGTENLLSQPCDLYSIAHAYYVQQRCFKTVLNM